MKAAEDGCTFFYEIGGGKGLFWGLCGEEIKTWLTGLLGQQLIIGFNIEFRGKTGRYLGTRVSNGLVFWPLFMGD